MAKTELYELESILYEIDYNGFVTIPLEKLYRLLGKGNKAAGTWKALLDVWEGIEGKRKELYVAELMGREILIAHKPLEQMTRWANE